MMFGICIIDSCCKNDEICFNLELRSLDNFNLDGNYIVTDVETVNANNYAIVVNSKAFEKTCSINFSSGYSLYAFDCDQPLITFLDEVNNISITSDSDLNANLLAGNELKQMFIPMEFNKECLNTNDINNSCKRDHFSFEGIETLEDAFNYLMSTNYYFKQVEKRDFEVLNLFSLRTDEIIIENNHKIKIKFEFKSGKIVELITDEITLN